MELYVSDLDGTLLNKNAEISVYTMKTLNNLIDRGLNFTVATARSYASVGKILNGVNLKLPVILMNGVLIYNPVSQKYDVVNTLSKQSCQKIISCNKELNLNCFMYTISNDRMMTFYERLSSDAMIDFYEERVNKYYKSFTHISDFNKVDEKVIYFTYIDNYERLLPLYESLKSDENLEITFYNDIYSDNLWYLEIFSSNASKKQGVNYLRKKYKFDSVSTFGDNLNDLPMFSVCEHKYAVKNANAEVINKCDAVIDSNENDGVAKFLEQIYGKDI